MKTKKRLKNAAKRKAKKIVLTHTILRHLRLIEHKHTGKLIHLRHTSHVALIGILMVVGFFLFISGNVTSAETVGGTVSIGVIVPGPAPTVGVTITSPKNGAKLTDKKTITVKGTCLKELFVVIQNNNILAGSTMCANDGTFELQIQLQTGTNVLTALNYDNLNQPGPVTPSVTVYVTQKTNPTDNKVNTDSIAPVLPINPSIIPGVSADFSNCNDYLPGKMSAGGDPHVAVACVPRLFGPKIQQVLGVLVWGGAPPYAINVDWGDGSESTLLMITTPGYKKESFSYASPGVYKITFKLKDANEKEAIVQTAVQVSGKTKTPLSSVTDDIFSTSWFKTPVPLYLMAVAITLGFWGGDIFDRGFGARKNRRRARKAT